jgi:hypothetical protein
MRLRKITKTLLATFGSPTMMTNQAQVSSFTVQPTCSVTALIRYEKSIHNSGFDSSALLYICSSPTAIYLWNVASWDGIVLAFTF